MVMIREAAPADAAALLAIYESYIDTPITFECEPPTIDEFQRRMREFSAVYPYLICEVDGCAAGYAYAHRQKERAAYQWNAELSVYLAEPYCGRGIGKALYAALIDILTLQNIKTVYAGVTVPNPKSEALHASFGFTRMGTYHSTGFKCGKWHDVAWFELPIGVYDEPPSPVLSIDQVNPAQIRAILENRRSLIRGGEGMKGEN